MHSKQCVVVRAFQLMKYGLVGCLIPLPPSHREGAVVVPDGELARGIDGPSSDVATVGRIDYII